MFKNRIFFSGILVLVGIIALSGCRSSRSSRTAARKTPPPPAQTVQILAIPGPSAQSVLTHADSSLARISQLKSEEQEAESNQPPPEQPPPAEMRTQWGDSYVPKPNLSDYGVYEAALGAYNGQRYDEAISLFSQIVNTGHPPELVPNAYYWMGESFYATDRYSESMPYFEYVTRVGPQYKAEISMFKLSRAGIHLGNWQDANTWYERLRNEYPKSHYIATLKKLGAR
jgi:TolA-binding protein